MYVIRVWTVSFDAASEPKTSCDIFCDCYVDKYEGHPISSDNGVIKQNLLP